MDYKDDSHLQQLRDDLFGLCRMLRIPKPSNSRLPGGNCLIIDPEGQTERISFHWLQSLNALQGLNPHYTVELRQVDDDFLF